MTQNPPGVLFAPRHNPAPNGTGWADRYPTPTCDRSTRCLPFFWRMTAPVKEVGTMADPRDHRGLSRALNAVTRILGTSHEDHPAASTSRSGHSSIVDCALYLEGVREPGEWDYRDALAAARRRPRTFVWLGLHEPGQDEFAEIANAFGLHELAVEDAIKSFQRPKIERYG